jgi:hypothetical protein
MRKTALKISGLIMFLIVSALAMAQKTDKVYLRNGDVLTGEIKYMRFALLKYDVEGPGKIDIKWEYIVKIRSDKVFQVTMQSGAVLITKLDDGFFDRNNSKLDSITEILRIKDRFLLRLDGNIDLGFNYAKANSAVQFNLSSSITYRIPKNEFTFKVNSVITHSSSDSIGSKKQDASFDYYKKLNNSFYINSLVGWQENSELGLQNRFAIPFVGGKILLNNNHQRLLTGFGVNYNLEQSSGNEQYTSNIESMFIIQFKEFRYSFPKLSIDSRFALFPGLSDWGRIRMGFNVSSKVEIFKDFNVGLSFYDEYDNRPLAGASSKNDYGINFTIGYIFGK